MPPGGGGEGGVAGRAGGPTRVDGILVLYHHPLGASAPTIREHVEAFAAHSRFPCWAVNTELGFPEGLPQLEFSVVVLHYSLFGIWPHMLGRRFLEYLDEARSSYKVAFFQDEYRFCRERFALLRELRVDCVYTLVEPPHFAETYGRHVPAAKVVWCLPAYVSETLRREAERLTLPDGERTVDVGYRGRDVSELFVMGRGAREKVEIATGFARRAQGSGLTLDVEIAEEKRIYGRAWYRFVASCRAVLGVEAGVSIFDLDGTAHDECARYLRENPGATFEQASRDVLHRWEDNVPYRTIAARHFEAAAFRTCQILFEGRYSGVMQPMVHYIPLRKDWSNFDEVLRLFRDRRLRAELAENAHRDLIASGRYSFASFVAGFDEEMASAGRTPGATPEISARVDRLLGRGRLRRQAVALARWARAYPYPVVGPLARRLRDRWHARGAAGTR